MLFGSQETRRLQKALLGLNNRGKQLMLRWVGQDVRSRARRLLNKKGITSKGKRRPSKPGEPPKKLRGTLRDLMLYEVDKTKGTVAIGPKHLAGKPSHRSSIPHVLESGGSVKAKVVWRKHQIPRWHYSSAEAYKRATQSKGFLDWVRIQKLIKFTTYRIAKRPFMAPALKQVLSEENVAKRYARALKASTK